MDFMYDVRDIEKRLNQAIESIKYDPMIMYARTRNRDKGKSMSLKHLASTFPDGSSSSYIL